MQLLQQGGFKTLSLHLSDTYWKTIDLISLNEAKNHKQVCSQNKSDNFKISLLSLTSCIRKIAVDSDKQVFSESAVVLLCILGQNKTKGDLLSRAAFSLAVPCVWISNFTNGCSLESFNQVDCTNHCHLVPLCKWAISMQYYVMIFTLEKPLHGSLFRHWHCHVPLGDIRASCPVVHV